MEDNKNFKPLSFWQELFLKKEELGNYYKEKRKYLYENGELFKNLKIKEKLHPVLMKLMELNRKFIEKQTLKIIKDDSTKTDKPVIYAITHLGMYDYQIVSEALQAHQIPFSGDPEEMYRTFEGAILELNGVIYCDTDDKEDRHIAKETSIELLKSGRSLLIYPEGVWNLTPNLLTLPLFPGIIEMAFAANVDIVPVAIEQYEKDFIVNIGKNFKVSEYITKEEAKERLRDEMATLKWEIIETMPIESRKELGDYATSHREFVDRRLYEWFNKKENKPYYNDQLVKNRTYREKNITLPESAFSYFKSIKLNKNNAFMFKKDESLPNEIQDEIEEQIRK